MPGARRSFRRSIGLLASLGLIVAVAPVAAPAAPAIDGRAPTTTTLTVRFVVFGNPGYHAAGTVTPNHAGESVRLALYARPDRESDFGVVARKRERLTETSDYEHYFFEPLPVDATSCKIVARFRGDVDHLPSEAKEKFTC